MNWKNSIMFWGHVAGALLLALWAYLSPARAHDAPSGWQYPAMCCHKVDCAPVDAVKFIDGEDKANTKHHSGISMNPQKYTHRLPSPDSQFHICATPDAALTQYGRTYYCIFTPTGF